MEGGLVFVVDFPDFFYVYIYTTPRSKRLQLPAVLVQRRGSSVLLQHRLQRSPHDERDDESQAGG